MQTINLQHSLEADDGGNVRNMLGITSELGKCACFEVCKFFIYNSAFQVKKLPRGTKYIDS